MGLDIVYRDPEAGLAVHSSGRYLTRNGSPFLIHGDTPWSIAAQLDNTEITTYMEDRAAKSFTAIMFNAIEHYYTSQSPAYRNVSGNDPFTSMTDFASGLNSSYWSRVDHVVNEANRLGIVCVINPAYLGINGGSEGWTSEVSAESDADLQTYGAALANRYTQSNVMWCFGGDYEGTTGERNKQWNIVTGMRSVRTTDIITGHASPGGEAYTYWDGYTGWNLNFAYPGQTATEVYSKCETAYGRAGPIPFIMGEARYENTDFIGETTATDVRRQAYVSLLSGACGHFYGNSPVWHFNATPGDNNGVTWESELSGEGAADMAHVYALFNAYSWWLLEPKTDTSVISSALSSGTTRVCPAKASDSSFGFVWVPTSQTVTVVKSAFAPSLIRVRLYDPTAGTYSTHTASTSNSGTLDVATGGERVVVVDAA